jgi:glycosyltransferase involved in cell wall biosynthesis
MVKIPIQVHREIKPVNIIGAVSVFAYLLIATLIGTVTVITQNLNTVIGVYVFPQGLAAYLIGTLTKRKVVILSDGGDVDFMIEKPMLRKVTKMYMARVFHVTALNHSKANKLQRLGINAEICPIIGVDTSRFAFTPFTKKRRRTAILYVGRLSSEKNPNLLLNAMNELRLRGLPLELIIVGEGPLRDELSERANLMGLGGSVTFEGYVPHSAIPRYFQDIGIFVLPSHREGSSVALMEAMSSGCLCIVSDIPDNIDLIKNMDNGITFRANDYGDLAEKIYWAATQSLSKFDRMTENARHLVEHEYSSRAVANALRSLLSPGSSQREAV